MENVRFETQLTILQVDGLWKQGLLRSMKPYLLINVDDGQLIKTHYASGTFRLTWGFNYKLVVNPKSIVLFQLFDQKRVNEDSDGFIGLGAVTIDSIMPFYCSKDEFRTHVTLQSSSGSYCGSVYCQFKRRKLSPEEIPNDKSQTNIAVFSDNESNTWETRIDDFGHMYYYPSPPLSVPPSITLEKLHTLNDEQLQRDFSGFLFPENLKLKINLDPNIIRRLLENYQVAQFVRQQVAVEKGPLPSGWEMRLSEDYHIYFVDHTTKTTTWTDPRESLLPGKPIEKSQSLNESYLRKLQYMYERPEMAVNNTQLQLRVSRATALEDAYDIIMKLSIQDMRKRLLVRFRNEDGLDYGGVSREFFYILSHALFDPSYSLFEYATPDNYGLQISPSSYFNPEHLTYFRFVGRIMGLAIFHRRYLDVQFVLPFYKRLLQKPLVMKDFKDIDEVYYESLKWMLENEVDDSLCLNFSCEENRLGDSVTIDLKPNGRNLPVNDENKEEYIQLLTNYKLVRSTQLQFEALKGGLNELIPDSILFLFNENELDILLNGKRDIDVEDWKRYTDYRAYTETDRIAIWFWEIVSNWPTDKKEKLLQFSTGTSRLPLGGFKDLHGSDGPRKFTLENVGSVFQLPKAHTCFNRLDIPPYESKEELEHKLTIAIEETAGFGTE
ncbi:HECT-type ubiquitin-protein ligase E3 Pub2 [Schizosaccharomyces osmophilus]|uniref:HECT-type E3 ubiquitin transferase n=1 Tax=Schizosaccharomyces osmophilus TaxID=2545709 RepID=A0AAE9WD91_9SCHI|nr:HECT-type ubiquitin-protein ligase E3 Pub2 [Schizosaccharomyces osmophilus]WBW73047.1 HECT-type ubiquitin-protein ligase E3 Pub2 [Schizosaccharomyces osmophilus]